MSYFRISKVPRELNINNDNVGVACEWMAPSIATATTHYALVIDAGSSGSRLQIYSWRDPSLERAEILAAVRHGKGKGKERETAALRRLVRVGKGVEGDDWVKRVEPGLSTQTPSSLVEYLSPLLSHALRHIPPSQHAQTPIYVLATAGMRLLPPQRQHSLLNATCKLLRQYPFMTGGEHCENVQIISGEEEGMWGWVAINYLMDGFGHAPKASKDELLPLAPLADPPPDSSKDRPTLVDVKHHSPTFGFLDMGGASTQLAFSPTWTELERSGYPRDQLREVSLRLLSGEDVSWPVFVASWLGFGTNKARDRYVETKINKWKDAQTGGTMDMTPVEDPCLPAGLLHESTPSGPPFLGTGDFATCLTQLHPLLLHSTPCPTNHCLFAGLPTPQIDFARDDQRGFIGVSEYWYTAQQVLGLGGVWDWAEWERGMGEFCSRDWTDVKVELEKEKGWKGAQIELSRLEMQCFKGAWISNVLHDGIGIPRLTDKGGNTTLTGGQVGDTNDEAERRAREKGLKSHHFQSMDEIGETAISWTLGKMVIEASKAVPRSYVAPWDQARTGFERKLGALGIEVLWAYAFIAFTLCACFYAGVRKHRWGLPSRRGRKVSGGDYKPAKVWRAPEDAEEGGRARLSTGPLRKWAIRANRAVRRIPIFKVKTDRPRPLRMASMPNLGPSPPLSPSMSPKSYFFTPADQAGGSLHPSGSRASLTGTSRSPGESARGLTSSGSASAVDVAGTVPAPLQGSPPRSKPSSVRGKTRQGVHGHLSVLTSETTSAGWNDPPVLSREPQHRDSLSIDEPGPGGVLTPSAGGANSAISRNSSRVNLNDLGLALRSTSRATTPFDNEE